MITPQEPGGTWFPLHSEVVMENGQILCTRNPTGHRVLIDYRFELPCGKQKRYFSVMSPSVCGCSFPKLDVFSRNFLKVHLS